MSKFESSAATRVLGLVAVTAALAACSNGVLSSTEAGSSSDPASPPAGSTTPLAVSDLPLGVTHAQVTTRDITYACADGSSVAAWLVAPSGNGSFAAALSHPAHRG